MTRDNLLYLKLNVCWLINLFARKFRELFHGDITVVNFTEPDNCYTTPKSNLQSNVLTFPKLLSFDSLLDIDFQKSSALPDSK